MDSSPPFYITRYARAYVYFYSVFYIMHIPGKSKIPPRFDYSLILSCMGYYIYMGQPRRSGMEVDCKT